MSDLKKQIKAMEQAKRQQVREQLIPQDVPVSFDHWYVIFNKQRQVRPHMKEIIWADFKARGLKKEEMAAKYDEALRLFGY